MGFVLLHLLPEEEGEKRALTRRNWGRQTDGLGNLMDSFLIVQSSPSGAESIIIPRKKAQETAP